MRQVLVDREVSFLLGEAGESGGGGSLEQEALVHVSRHGKGLTARRSIDQAKEQECKNLPWGQRRPRRQRDCVRA